MEQPIVENSRNTSDDRLVEGWLKTLRIDSLCEWDVLVFLYRHETSLVSAEYIARLLGYPTGGVVAAIEVLESKALVKRSRVSQGVRLYEFCMPQGSPRDPTFERLMSLADSRAGRLLVSEKLEKSAGGVTKSDVSPLNVNVS